jgi:2-oxoglutarate dehydrogenase E2 component (dihydrolipoamide succinyltransferase)
MAGGTYTISNGGVFGSMMGTPIINLPQTAVLGLHAIKDRPMVVNGKIEIRPVRGPHWEFCRPEANLVYVQMMYLALTYDHRLLDGREAVTFLVKIKVSSSAVARERSLDSNSDLQEYIEDPRKMLLA